MASVPDVSRSDLVPQIVGEDLHLVVPEDSNTAVVASQVDAQSLSSLHLDFDLVGDLVTVTF